MNQDNRMNLYFIVGARATTPAEAIAEAYKLAQQFGNALGVTVCECGTQRKFAKVSSNGIVSALSVEKEDQ